MVLKSKIHIIVAKDKSIKNISRQHKNRDFECRIFFYNIGKELRYTFVAIFT